MMDSSASKDEICVLSAAAAVVVTIGLPFVGEPISSSSSVVKTDKPLNVARLLRSRGVLMKCRLLSS